MNENLVINEYIEPNYPKNVKSSVVKKSGVQGSVIPIKQYSFITAKGNQVKVHFKITKDYDDVKTADIVFYVNDTLDDSSSQKGGSPTDPEIFNGVLGIILKASDRLKINRITFEPWSGEGDTKIVKGLSFKDKKEQFLNNLKQFKNTVEKREPKLFEPSDRMKELAKQLGREANKIKEFDKEKLLDIISKAISSIEEEKESIRGVLNDLELLTKTTYEAFPELSEIKEIIQAATKIIVSNTEQGFTVKRNRREAIYKKLMDRYFSDNWEIKFEYGKFDLERK
jgi:hypothetical protein